MTTRTVSLGTLSLVALFAGQAPGAAPVAPGDALSLYVLDLQRGEIRRPASEGAVEFTYRGSPDWSSDGKLLLFDASPGRDFQKTRIFATGTARDGRDERLTDLGPGNCPSWSPDGKSIAFLLNPGAAAGSEPGIWVMNADGSGRRRLGGSGISKWSPDGKQILTASFSNPCRLSLLDVDTGEQTPVVVEDHEIYSVPSWTGDGRSLVTVVRSTAGVSVALIDLPPDGRATVDRVLWRRTSSSEPTPLYPTYSGQTRRCMFAGRTEQGMALYAVDADALEPIPLEPGRFRAKLASLSVSPDGTWLAFCGDPPAEVESERK